MKLKLLMVLAAALAGNTWAASNTRQLTPAVTTLAANSTNSTAGTDFAFVPAPGVARMWVAASGVAATTNGALTVELATSPDGVIFETAGLNTAPIAVSLSSLGSTATNVVSDWFVMGHASSVRVARIRNTFAGAVSNLQVWITWQDPPK